MKSFIFWDISSCSPLKVSRHFRETCRLHLQGWRISQARNQHQAGVLITCFTLVSCLLATCFMLVSCMAYSLNLKMEVTCSSETSVDFQWTAWRYIPEDRTLHTFYVWYIFFPTSFVWDNWTRGEWMPQNCYSRHAYLNLYVQKLTVVFQTHMKIIIILYLFINRMISDLMCLMGKKWRDI
jgi:hypothetical protein